MAEMPDDQLSGELAEHLQDAEKLGRSPELYAAFSDAVDDPSTWERAARDPQAFLSERGIEIPHGLGVEFLDDPFRGRPVPDFEFFKIRLTRCRTYWMKKKNAPGYEEVTICWGIEIVPNPVPGGPIG